MLDSLKEELRRPATVVAVMLSIASIFSGVFVSMYFYRKSIVQGTMYYDLRQYEVFVREAMENKEQKIDSPFKVLDRDGNTIDDSIFVAELKVWNAGNGELTKDSIRVPYRINVGDGAKVISIRVGSPDEDDFSEIKILPGYILSWSHFDPGAGAVVQIVYSSKTTAPITIVGSSIGAPAPVQFDRMTDELGIWTSFLVRHPGWIRQLSYPAFLLVTLTLMFFILRERREYWMAQGAERVGSRIERRYSSVLPLVVMILIFFSFIAESILEYLWRVPPPPF